MAQTVPSHRWGLCLKGDFLGSEEKLVNGGGNGGRDSRDDEDSRDSGATKHQDAPRCQAQTSLSHAPWDAPAATNPWTGTRRGSRGNWAPRASRDLLAPCEPAAAAQPDGTGASAELGDTASSPPALDPAAPSQPGHRGRGQPGQGRPRSLSGADGSGVGRTEAAQRVLPFMHTQRDSRRLRLRREVPLGPALAVHFTRVQRA